MRGDEASKEFACRLQGQDVVIERHADMPGLFI
jgi:hypothetical protein